LNYAQALTVKFAIIAALVLFTMTPWITLPVRDGLVIALPITLALYYLGDRFAFPSLGNIWATAIDVGLAFMIAWLVPVLFGLPPVGLLHAAVLAIAIGAAQFFTRPLFASRRTLR